MLVLNYVFHALIATIITVIVPVPPEFKAALWLVVMLFINGLAFGSEWIDEGRGRPAVPQTVRTAGRSLLLTGLVVLVYRGFTGRRGGSSSGNVGGTGGAGSGMPRYRSR